MSEDRIAALQRMLERNPGDARLRFGLAAEHERRAEWPHVVEELRAYLAVADDQGNAWGRLGHALRQLGRDAEAREAYRAGAEAARRHGHPGMAAEFDAALEEWDS